jgi:FkbM family methyltransferase
VAPRIADMDIVGGVIARLDGPAPRWADRLRWRRNRRHEVALRVVDALVPNRNVVLDIGAALGHFSSRMLDLVGANGIVHAFEPNPACHERLRKLARRAPLVLHPIGLSDHDADATLHIPIVSGRPFVGWATLEDRDEFELLNVAVRVARLDHVLADNERVTFIKCDVEGHEDSVMRGAEELLRRAHPSVLIELEQRHRAAPVRQAMDFFAGLGYEGWSVHPGGLRPVSCFDLERDQLSFLGGAPSGEAMPRGYVHDFLFVMPDTDVTGLVDPSVQRPRSVTSGTRRGPQAAFGASSR